jgi:hypothetical protein
MAKNPCIVTFDGKEYSYADFATELHNGLLDNLIADKSVDPVKLSGTTSILQETPEGTKRGVIKSAQESEVVAENAKAEDIVMDLDKAKTSYYEPQKIVEAQEAVESLSEAEKLAEVRVLKEGLNKDSKQNVAILAGISLFNEYLRTGRTEEAKKVAEDMALIGTAAGQVIRQFGELKSSTPESFTFFFDEFLKGKGFNLTEIQKADFAKLFDAQQKAREEFLEATKEHAKEVTLETEAAKFAAEKKYEDAKLAMSKKMQRFLPKKFFETLGMGTQGNMLGPLSIETNPYSNMMYRFASVPARAVSAAVDFLVSKVLPSELDRTRLSRINKTQAKKLLPSVLKGIKSAVRKGLKGNAPKDLEKYDIQRQLNPIEAWKDIFRQFGLRGDAELELPKKADGSFDTERFLSNAYEGTFGVAGNIMLRLLPIGDDPFYEPAKMASLIEQGQIKGLKGKDLESFLISPDESSLKIAEKEAEKATFQDQTMLSKTFTWFNKQIDSKLSDKNPILADAIKYFVFKINVPFIKTPASVLDKSLNYSIWQYSAAKAVLQGAQGKVALSRYLKLKSEIEKSKTVDPKKVEKLKELKADFDEHRKAFVDNVGAATVAGAASGLAIALVSRGLITKKAKDDDSLKSKKLKEATGGEDQLNYSALKRGLATGDYSVRADDKKKDLNKMGIIGAALIINANSVKDLGKTPKKLSYTTSGDEIPEEKLVSILSSFSGIEGASAGAKFALDQSFYQGANALANAIVKGEYDNYGQQYLRSLTSAFGPNTIDALSRANREYAVVTKDEGFIQQFINGMKAKYGIITGGDKDLPLKRGLFGEPIKQNPTQENPYVYQLLDVTKTSDMFSDPLYKDLLMLFQESGGEEGLIPEPPKDVIELKDKKIKLTQKEYSEYQQYIGDARRLRAEELIITAPGYSDELLEKIKKAYQTGEKEGRKKFLEENNIN